MKWYAYTAVARFRCTRTALPGVPCPHLPAIFRPNLSITLPTGKRSGACEVLKRLPGRLLIRSRRSREDCDLLRAKCFLSYVRTTRHEEISSCNRTRPCLRRPQGFPRAHARARAELYRRPDRATEPVGIRCSELSHRSGRDRGRGSHSRFAIEKFRLRGHWRWSTATRVAAIAVRKDHQSRSYAGPHGQTLLQHDTGGHTRRRTTLDPRAVALSSLYRHLMLKSINWVHSRGSNNA